MPNLRKPRTFIPSKYTRYTVHAAKIQLFRKNLIRETFSNGFLVKVYTL